MKTLVELFCDVDDFCQAFVPAWQRQLLESGVRQRCRESRMSLSEIMTLLIAFHSSHQRDFKNYYTGFVAQFYKRDFPTLLSDTRFLEVMPRALGPLCAYFTHLKGRPTGIEFVDSTTLKVCHNLRIRCVITHAFLGTKCSRVLPSVAAALWAGFMALNCTLSSITPARLPLSNSRPITVITTNRRHLDNLCTQKHESQSDFCL